MLLYLTIKHIDISVVKKLHLQLFLLLSIPETETVIHAFISFLCRVQQRKHHFEVHGRHCSAAAILKDPTHPHHGLFTFCPQDEGLEV